jgi:hypothetical protein
VYTFSSGTWAGRCLFVDEAIGLSLNFVLKQDTRIELIAWGLVKNKPFASNFWKNHHRQKSKIHVIETILSPKWH